MPYIPKEHRRAVRECGPEDTAELCYLLYSTAVDYMHDMKLGTWNELSDVYKAIHLAADEFKRRYIHPHEDEAIKRNGDIY